MTSDIEGGVSVPQSPPTDLDPGPPPPPAAPSSAAPAIGQDLDESFMTPDFEPPPDAELIEYRRPGWVGAVVGLVLGASLIVATLYAIGVIGGPLIPSDRDGAPSPTTAAGEDVPDDPDAGIRAIAAAALPAVVSIEVLASEPGDNADPARVVGTGSAIVITTDGYLVTSHHVVEGAVAIDAVLSDGTVFPAEWVGSDPFTDLAVIKIEAAGLTALEFGPLGGLEAGDPAITVGGSPGLQGGTNVTPVIVSALDRRLDLRSGDRLYGLIETDSPIIFGSSGGALLDEEGTLIGIATAVGAGQEGAEGLGFAVPGNVAAVVVAELMAAGRVDHAYLGFQGETHFVIGDDGRSTPAGARVFAFGQNSVLEAAGAEIGDVIVALDGTPISTMDQLVTLIRMRRAGQTADLGVLSNSVEQTLTVQFGSHP